MSEPDELGYREGALLTVKQTFLFSGRSGHTELFGYYFFSMVAGLALVFSAGWFVSIEVETLLSYAVNLLVLLPFPALLVRRLHDQDRTGKLAWLMVVPALHLLGASLASLLGGTEGRIAFDQKTYLLYWPAQACAIALVAFYLWPGTNGPNRFGDDPRTRQALTRQD